MIFQDHNKTTNMNRPFEWRRRPGSSYDQKSKGSRRETSPVSITSACGPRSSKFNSCNAKAISSQRPVYNHQAGSRKFEKRSMDSHAICATDIVMALKKGQFNNNDTMIIEAACNRFLKLKRNGRRKRIEKRRNLRIVKLMRSRNRWKSGYDSGELGSNSSISSDDNWLVRTSNNKSNKSGYKSTDFKRTTKESHMFQDHSDNFRQNKMQISGELPYLNSLRASVTSKKSVIEKPTSIKSMPTVNFYRTQNQNSLIQKERLKDRFLLPSQHFDRSVAATSIPEGTESPHDSNKNCGNLRQIPQIDPSSNDEEIFTERSKRRIDTVDDVDMPKQKKSRDFSPCKNMTQSFRSSTIIKANHDFEFANPAFPVNKELICSLRSIITARNNEVEDISDTFTHEDILHSEQPPPQAATLKSRPNKVAKKAVTKNIANKVVEKNVAVQRIAKSPTEIAQVTQEVLAENNGKQTTVSIDVDLAPDPRDSLPLETAPELPASSAAPSAPQPPTSFNNAAKQPIASRSGRTIRFKHRLDL